MVLVVFEGGVGGLSIMCEHELVDEASECGYTLFPVMEYGFWIGVSTIKNPHATRTIVDLVAQQRRYN